MYKIKMYIIVVYINNRARLCRFIYKYDFYDIYDLRDVFNATVNALISQVIFPTRVNLRLSLTV